MHRSIRAFAKNVFVKICTSHTGLKTDLKKKKAMGKLVSLMMAINASTLYVGE